MTCPHCGKRISPKAIKSEAARLNVAKRIHRTPGTGRPIKAVTCPRCGEIGGTAAMRRHKC